MSEEPESPKRFPKQKTPVTNPRKSVIADVVKKSSDKPPQINKDEVEKESKRSNTVSNKFDSNKSKSTKKIDTYPIPMQTINESKIESSKSNSIITNPSPTIQSPSSFYNTGHGQNINPINPSLSNVNNIGNNNFFP